MFFIATGKMPSISNGRASARHVGRVSSGTFVRLVSPSALLLLLGTWGAAVFLLPLCKRRAVLCFSRDANHEIPLDKLIYFSRCFSLFGMYGLMYSILETVSLLKKIYIPGALTKIIALAKFLARPGHGALPLLIIHVTNKLKSYPKRSQTCGAARCLALKNNWMEL